MVRGRRFRTLPDLLILMHLLFFEVAYQSGDRFVDSIHSRSEHLLA